MKRLEESILFICGHVKCIIYFSSYLPLSLSLRIFPGAGGKYLGLCRLVLEQFGLGKGINIRVWVQRRVFFQEPDHDWLKILV